MLKLIVIGFIALSFSSYISYTLYTSNLGLSEMKKSSIEKMTTSIMDDLDRAMPLIKKAGYDVTSIQAQLSIPPEVTTSFELQTVVSKKQQEIILKALQDNAIGTLVLKSLMGAFELDESISMKNLQLKKIHITISLPPYVTVEYEK